MTERRDDEDMLAPVSGMISSKLLVVGNLLRRGAALHYRRVLDLPRVEWAIIANLGRRPPVGLNELCGFLALEKAQVSRSITSLVGRALVTRAPNPRNSREVLIALTDAGLRAHDEIVRSGTARNRAMLAALTPIEAMTLDTLLDRLAARLRDLRQQEDG